MSNAIALTFLALALVVALVIVIWAALILGKADGSDQDKRIHLWFSGTLPAGLLLLYFFQNSLGRNYFDVFLLFVLELLAWVGSLVLCLSGIKLVVSARRHQKPFMSLLLAAFLTGSIFIAGCIALGYG
jgi:hypothetical protein